MKKPRYKAGYDDGSGGDESVYDTKRRRTIAVTTWGCGCCRPEPTALDKEDLTLIVTALNQYEEKPHGKKKSSKVEPRTRRARVQPKSRR